MFNSVLIRDMWPPCLDFDFGGGMSLGAWVEDGICRPPGLVSGVSNVSVILVSSRIQSPILNVAPDNM